MVLVIKLGFGRYIDVKKSPIEDHLKYLLKVRLSYFQNIINQLNNSIVYLLNKSRSFWFNKYLHFKYYTVNY